MPRAVNEWIGADDNTPVPPRVRLRVLAAFGYRCADCGREITAGVRWICDHIVAIINGGGNRERNLQPLCDWCDRTIKTPADVADKSRVAKVAKAHFGAKAPSRRPMMGSRASGWRRPVDPRKPAERR